MKLLRPKWGEFGYIYKKRNVEIIKTSLMFIIALSIYFIALSVLKTNKNIFTVIAVLTVLPAAKCAVSMIMFIRYKSIKLSEYNAINGIVDENNIFYEIIFTTQQQSFLVKACAVMDNTIIMYSVYDAKDIKKLTEHIKTCLERDYIKGYSLKVFSEIDAFTNRLAEMNNNLSDESESIKPVKNLFRSISL